MSKSLIAVAAVAVLVAVLVGIRGFGSRNMPADEGDTLADMPGAESVPAPGIGRQDAGRGTPTDSDGKDCVRDPELQIWATNEDRERIRREAIKTLAGSDDADYLMAAALFSKWDEAGTAYSLLEQLGGFDSDDPVVVWLMLGICEQRPGPQCDLSLFDQVALRRHRNNGSLWLASAANALQSGDDARAFQALRNAATAPEFDIYYDDQLRIVDLGLSAATSLPASQRLGEALAVISTHPYDLRGLVARCDEETDGEWPELCDQLGQQMASRGQDALTQRIGLRLQSHVARNRGDDAAVRDFEKQGQGIRERLESAGLATMDRLLRDEALQQEFLANLAVYGEAEALVRAVESIRRRNDAPGFDACD